MHRRLSLGLVRFALTVGLVLVGSSACSGTRGHSVVLRFDPESLSDRIDRIELSLVSSCASASELGPPPSTSFTKVDLARGEPWSGLGDVADRDYGLYARGIGPCVTATGCERIRVADDGRRMFEVTLHEISASMYDPAKPDNGGCGGDSMCREENGSATCACQQGYVYDGTTCVPFEGEAETYLSDWAWLSELNGWGPVERDRSNNDWHHGDGNPLRIRGATYDKGLGVAAPSEVRINLDGRCSRFSAVTGIDDEAATHGEALVEVWVDGINIYQSGTLTGKSAAQVVDVDVQGVNELRLVVRDITGTGKINSDSVDWADAKVVCEEGWRGDAILTAIADWPWEEESNGEGPAERDQSNGGEAQGDGATITLNGEEYERGVGVSAASEIQIDLGGHCRRFRSDVGVDDETVGGGSVIFQVWGDEEMLFESGPMRASSPTQSVNVDLVDRSALRLVVEDAGDGTRGDHASWAGATLLCASGWRGERVETYLSDWVFQLAENTWGPVERDRSCGGDQPNDGGPIRINGVEYARGIGVRAHSILRFNLDERCRRFRASVGIDDDAEPGGEAASVMFRVLADGVVLFESETQGFGEPADEINVDVTGRSRLVLEADSLGDETWDNADWGNARLSCDPGALGI